MSVETIAVATDGSAGAARAVDWAAGLAAQIGARVVIVHVFQPLAHLSHATPPMDFEALRDEAATALAADWCAPLIRLGVDYETVVVEGDPARAIIDTADRFDADLIVVGARGLSTFKSLLVGSTSHKLAHLSKRPVTIVPASTTE